MFVRNGVVLGSIQVDPSTADPQLRSSARVAKAEQKAVDAEAKLAEAQARLDESGKAEGEKFAETFVETTPPEPESVVEPEPPAPEPETPEPEPEKPAPVKKTAAKKATSFKSALSKG